ncbi:MAG: hypothetical protein A2270_09630 [Elusimicrobia bacterium RIFOXYA12_FULL_51_18]|nr:MAG: hypothetical protein A2270_09630 [Elusimicrobia bacterium RIFOXYA12_FULL_51_18]OGS32762.1 MAG: hypothetical protein A2218_11945 [Elusimicrobia bacterium RIFOXYA2_FULL_53_38]
MRITVGVKSLKEADYFLHNGADEIHFSLKTVPGHRAAAFSNEKELLDSVKLAIRLRKKTMLGLNAVYPREKYPLLLRHARKMTDHGLDGIIVRDPALLEYFNTKKFRPYFVSSILCACFNSQAMEFYQDLGVRRFTLHSQILPQDVKMMVSAAMKTETVVFAPCIFLAANLVPFCLCPYPESRDPGGARLPDHACTLRYKCGGSDFRMLDSNLYFQADMFYDFYGIGVHWLKVPRQMNTPKLIADFKITLFLNQLLEKGIDRKTFAVAVAELVKRADMNKYGKSYHFKPFPDKPEKHA